ncbi:MAG: MCP four helix bundle domain-containing protein, partial [Aquabacterium sp.]|nr:MCP four helix bundle domain-containing protein [Aquabacterium sp.]
MKLGTKLLLAPLLTGLIALAGGGLNAALMARQSAASADAFRTDLDKLRTITQVEEQLGQLHAGVYRTVALIGSMDEPAIKTFRTELKRQVDGVAKAVSAVAGTTDRDEGLRKQVDQISGHLQRYVQQADNAVDMASVDPNTGAVSMQSADQSFKAVSKTMTDIVALIDSQAVAATAASSQRAGWQTLALLLAS